MNLRSLFTGLGVGITAALLTTILVIELLEIELSAVIGLPLGILGGSVGGVLVARRHDTLSKNLRWLAATIAGFGYGILLTLALTYINLVDISFEETLTVGGGAALLSGLAALLADRRA